MSNFASSVGLFRQKMSHAKRLIDIHNYLRKPTADDNRVVYEEFLQKLIAMGGTSDEMLREVTSEDLHQIAGLPVLMARRLAEIFQADKLEFEVSPEGAIISKGGSNGTL
jgi:hypothetical protein